MKRFLALIRRLFAALFGHRKPYRHYSAILGSDQP